MAVALPGMKSLQRLFFVARPISSGTRDRLAQGARALALLAGSHMFISTTAADECRSCEFSRAVPAGVWQEFSESLAALDRFTLADEALAQRLMASAGMRPDAAGSVIGDEKLQRFIYPWKAELFQDRLDPGEHDAANEEPEVADDTSPQQPTWLRVPDASNDDEDRPLTVSAADVRHEPASATQSRSSGKWYWEVRYLPGSANLPHAALIGIIDSAVAGASHDPMETMTALSNASFASLLGGETIQFALDLDGGALHYGINGAWNSDPASAPFGDPVVRGNSFAPAVLPRRPDLHPYHPDKFEFNFGRSNFRYSIPAGYRPYDISAAQTAASPKPRNATVAHSAHERAFLAKVREFEQEFDPTTDRKLKEALKSWRVYRNAACRLNAKFKRSKGVDADPGCLRAFGGALLAALPKLRHWNRLSMDPPFDELPPIALEQPPKLHYVELDGSDMPENPTFFADGRPTAAVRVSDMSGPLILFLRAYNATHWQITVEAGVNVQHVFLFGQSKQTATVSGNAASIRSYSAEQDNSGKLWRLLYKGEEGQDSLATALEALVGVPPASMQRGCKNARCEIAGNQATGSTGALK